MIRLLKIVHSNDMVVHIHSTYITLAQIQGFGSLCLNELVIFWESCVNYDGNITHHLQT